MSDDKYYCTKKAAQYLGVSKSKLEKARLQKQGPPFYQERKGSKVLYLKSDLEGYMQQIKNWRL